MLESPAHFSFQIFYKPPPYTLHTFTFFAFQSKIQHSTFKNLTSTLLIAYPGLTQEMLAYKIRVIREFVKRKVCLIPKTDFSTGVQDAKIHRKCPI
jgi:hypothetical protein